MIPRACSGYLYDVLDIRNRNAGDEEIKRQYRRMALRYHPDKNVNADDGAAERAAERFREVEESYRILSNPQQRKVYDTYGRGGLETFSFLFQAMDAGRSANGDNDDAAEETEAMLNVVVSVLTNLSTMIRLLFVLMLVLVLVFVSGLLSLYKFDHFYPIYPGDGQRWRWRWATLWVPLWILIVPVSLVGLALLLFALWELVRLLLAEGLSILCLPCCCQPRASSAAGRGVAQAGPRHTTAASDVTVLSSAPDSQATVASSSAAAATDSDAPLAPSSSSSPQTGPSAEEEEDSFAARTALNQRWLAAFSRLCLGIDVLFLALLIPATLCAAISFKMRPFSRGLRPLFIFLCYRAAVGVVFDHLPCVFKQRMDAADEVERRFREGLDRYRRSTAGRGEDAAAEAEGEHHEDDGAAAAGAVAGRSRVRQWLLSLFWAVAYYAALLAWVTLCVVRARQQPAVVPLPEGQTVMSFWVITSPLFAYIGLRYAATVVETQVKYRRHQRWRCERAARLERQRGETSAAAAPRTWEECYEEDDCPKCRKDVQVTLLCRALGPLAAVYTLAAWAQKLDVRINDPVNRDTEHLWSPSSFTASAFVLLLLTFVLLTLLAVCLALNATAKAFLQQAAASGSGGGGSNGGDGGDGSGGSRFADGAAAAVTGDRARLQGPTSGEAADGADSGGGFAGASPLEIVHQMANSPQYGSNVRQRTALSDLD